jgi:hypothetical protein
MIAGAVVLAAGSILLLAGGSGGTPPADDRTPTPDPTRSSVDGTRTALALSGTLTAVAKTSQPLVPTPTATPTRASPGTTPTATATIASNWTQAGVTATSVTSPSAPTATPSVPTTSVTPSLTPAAPQTEAAVTNVEGQSRRDLINRGFPSAGLVGRGRYSTSAPRALREGQQGQVELTAVRLDSQVSLVPVVVNAGAQVAAGPDRVSVELPDAAMYSSFRAQLRGTGFIIQPEGEVTLTLLNGSAAFVWLISPEGGGGTRTVAVDIYADGVRINSLFLEIEVTETQDSWIASTIDYATQPEIAVATAGAAIAGLGAGLTWLRRRMRRRGNAFF